MVLTPVTRDDLAFQAVQSRREAVVDELIPKSAGAALAYETGYLRGVAAVAETLKERALDEGHLVRVLGADESNAERTLEEIAAELEEATA